MLIFREKSFLAVGNPLLTSRLRLGEAVNPDIEDDHGSKDISSGNL